MTATESQILVGAKPKLLDQQSPDLPAVLTLLQNSFAYMDGRIEPPSSMSRMTLQTLQEHAEKHEVWGISSPPVACMFLTIHPDHVYLGKLAVTDRYRRQGLAKILVKTAKDRARQLGAKNVRLQVRVELSENQKFFSEQGFREVSRTSHPGYDRPTSITFEWASTTARHPVPQ